MQVILLKLVFVFVVFALRAIYSKSLGKKSPSKLSSLVSLI